VHPSHHPNSSSALSFSSSLAAPVTNLLVDLDFDVIDTVFFEKLQALGGHLNAVKAIERCRHHTNPEDDGEIPSGVPNAHDVNASLFHIHRVQKVKHLTSQVVLPGLVDRVIADGRNSLSFQVSTGPVGGAHRVGLVRATKRGEEGRPW
jgi:hypothetical protein